MCSGFTHQHTVEDTHPRSQPVKASSPSPPHPYLLLPLCDSILPFLSLNTLPLANSSTLLIVLPFLSSLLPFLPRGFHHTQSLVSLMSFTCQLRRECACSSRTKEKHPPVISENAARRRGQGVRSTGGGQRELDNMGSGVKRKNVEGRR